jgi:hypothetical protein
MILEDVIKHIRHRKYMSGVQRDRTRIKSSGEVFTPSELCIKVMDQLEKDNPTLFTDPTKTFLDPAAGDGQLLGEALIRKMERGSTFEQALETIYGVDLMIDNVDACRDRLLCGQEHLRHIVEKNIVRADGLKYGYTFLEMGPARRRTESRFRKLASVAGRQNTIDSNLKKVVTLV